MEILLFSFISSNIQHISNVVNQIELFRKSLNEWLNQLSNNPFINNVFKWIIIKLSNSLELTYEWVNKVSSSQETTYE